MKVSDSHHEANSEISDLALDNLLAQHTLQPPDNFVAQVMATVDEQDRQNVYDTKPATQKLTWWQWLAVLAGAPGMVQAIALVFSAWHISSAG